MFRFLHAADLHLDSPLLGLERYEGAPVTAIRRASRRALENLVELAIQEAIDFVVLAGDQYNGDWKDYNTGLFFIKQMARLHEHHIPVFAITGNHDAANKMTRVLRLPPNVVMLPVDKPATQLLEEHRVAIHGQGFASAAVTENLAQRYPEPHAGYFNIGILHTSANQWDRHERYAPCSVDDLVGKRYDYWALGHIHDRIILHERPWVVFSGNIQGRHFQERGPKGCMLVTVDNDHQAQLTFRPLDVFRWDFCTVDVGGADSEYAVVDRVASELHRLREHHGLPLALRVFVEGETAAHEALAGNTWKWTAEIRGQADTDTWIERVEWRTHPPPGPLPTDGPVGELSAWLSELNDDPDQAIALCRELKDLNDLSRKLEQQTGTALLLDDPEAMRETIRDVLGQVGPLLKRRLQVRGPSE